MIRKSNTGFTMTEALASIAAIGCIVLLGIGMFSQVGMDGNITQTKQARLESALKTATLSIIGKENSLSVQKACSANSWKNMLLEKVMDATDGGTIKVNGKDAQAIRVKGAGTIAIQIASGCSGTWGKVTEDNTNPPVSLYAIPNERVEKISVPIQVIPGANKTTSGEYTDETGSTFVASSPVTSYGVQQDSVSETYSSSATVATEPGTKASATPANTIADCWNGSDYSYTSSCVDQNGNHVNVPFYMLLNDNTRPGAACVPAYCPGNGMYNGQLVTSGKVNNACDDEFGNVSQCICPHGKPYWAEQYVYNDDIAGICLETCAEIGMVESTEVPGTCVCPEGSDWDNDIKRCVRPDECPEEYLVWDGAQCVCDYAKTKPFLNYDEIYTNDKTAECRQKCDTANYWVPNQDQTECIRQLPDCPECLKELNMSTYTCQCKVNTTNADLVNCGVADNKYYTGTGSCVADCDRNYKIRNTQNIASCICPATQPQGITFGQYEVYDPTNPATCKSCNTANTNRIYATGAQEGNCVCMDSIAIDFAADEVYDTTQPNCKNVCPEGEVPDATHTYCYNPDPVCGCLEIMVNHKCVCNENITTAQLKACSALRAGNIFDATAPECQAPCNGTAVPAESLKACSCSCLKSYNGQTCVCDPNAIDQKCLNPDEKFDASQYTCKTCKEPNRQYNQSGVCVCKPANQITYSGSNMKYDPNAATCESPCASIGIRNLNNPTECVCPTAKPSTFVIQPGYHYQASSGLANSCQALCVVGDYCPGTNPQYPDRPIVDPADPNPIVDTRFPEGDVMKCPCGTFGSTTGLSKAACSGQCSAGYNCPVGSTSATQVKCTGNQLCKAGVCAIETCSEARMPNAEHTACVCKPADQITYSGSNMKYDPNAESCQSPCESIGIRNLNNPTECVCPTAKPSTFVIQPGYHYQASSGLANSCQALCVIGDYCPGTNPQYPDRPIVDPADPNPIVDTRFPDGDVMKCPCGTFGSTTGLSKAACSGQCSAGYNCPAGSTSATQVKCTGKQLCKAGVCAIETCSEARMPNAEHTACVCKPADQIIYSGPNMKYDPNAESCQSPCGSIGLRDVNNPTECVCPTAKPSTFVIQPGYHYQASSGLANYCQALCVVGDYCPGTNPLYPDRPIVDPADPNPIVDTRFPDGDVMKCPCGTFGSTTGLSKAACSGQCSAGYNCPAGSTSATQVKCTGNQLCKAGVCAIETCAAPSTPNPQHTTCICPSVKPQSYQGVARGYYYNPTAGVQNSCQSICPKGNYCPGSNPEPDIPGEQNPDYPEGVLKCPCGTYGSTEGLYRSSCSGFCAAGYHCPSASISDKQENCPANNICLEGVCQPEVCQLPSVPDSTRTVCICAATKPVGVVITPGKHYDANAGVSNYCMSACPVGDYCPGTSPQHPDTLIVDPTDPNPVTDSRFTVGDVLKCPCGNFGSSTGLSKATCSGKCSAGYTCPAGSTKDKAQACAQGKICLYGVCEPQPCTSPLIANPAQTACICPATQPTGMVIEAGYYYDSNAVSTSCKSTCPSNQAQIQAWILAHADKFTKTTTVYDKTKVGCIGECTGNYIASVDKTACVCGLSAASTKPGQYFDAAACAYKDCPTGHYCPGNVTDPNPNPEQDPQYPNGVIKCPCGTYGSVTKLATYACSGSCQAGYRCPSGSTSKTAIACTAGQTCPTGTCTPGTCDFPSTSSSPYTSCNICRTEASIRQTNPGYISDDEVYSSELPTCKKCRSNKIYDRSGMCVCPDDKQLWYDDKCNKCQKWDKIYLLKQYSQYEPGCTLGKYMKGDTSCYANGGARVVGNDMKAAADKLSAADKARTFNGVFAYMVAENGNTAQVVGTFTINSWYTIFWQNQNDYTTNSATFPNNIQNGTCQQVCTVNGSANRDCVSTCQYLKNNIKTNTMTSSCHYAESTYPAYVGQTLGDPRDEYCSGGQIVMNNGCTYNIGGYLRRYASPLILDLKGDGFKFTTLEDGVSFDLNNDGFAERISWSAEQTEFDNAFLVLDKNKNGQVDNGGELFGDQNGSDNGFIELAKYDDNGDKKINKEDKIFNELLLWVDFNKNAKVDYDNNGKTRELKTLEEAGVTELSVGYEEKTDKFGNILKDIYGNITGIIGSFKMLVQDTTGKLVEVVRTMIDVFFMSE